jgi:hypothetical protein
LYAPLEYHQSYDSLGLGETVSCLTIGDVPEGSVVLPFHRHCLDLLFIASPRESMSSARIWDLCHTPKGGRYPSHHHLEPRLRVIFEGNPLFNPQHIENLLKFLQGVATAPMSDESINRGISGAMTPRLAGDAPITSIPQEIWLQVACHLPVKDVKNARLAIRPFQPVFDEQSFWMTRFEQGFELSWFFEIRKIQEQFPKHPVWRQVGLKLMKQIQSQNLELGYEKRRILWETIEQFLSIIHLEWKPSTRLASSTPKSELDWISIITDANKLNADWFPSLCGKSISSFTASILHTSNGTYVTGIRFTGNEAEHKISEMGWWGGSFVTQKFPSKIQFRGLMISSAADGIKAVRCLFWDNTDEAEKMKTWVGDPTGGVISRRLLVVGAGAKDRRDSELHATFDVSAVSSVPFAVFSRYLTREQGV